MHTNDLGIYTRPWTGFDAHTDTCKSTANTYPGTQTRLNQVSRDPLATEQTRQSSELDTQDRPFVRVGRLQPRAGALGYSRYSIYLRW